MGDGHESFEEVLEVLRIRDVSAVRNQGILTDRENALNILKPSKAAKARCTISLRSAQSTRKGVTQVVGSKDDAVVVFHGEDRGANNLGFCGVRCRPSGGGCGGVEGGLHGLHWVHVCEERGRHRRLVLSGR